MIKNINNEKFFVNFFFITYFIIGFFLTKDYGIAFDEDTQRDLGQNRIDYIKSFFLKIFGNAQSSDVEVKIKHPEYGVLFEVFALWVEKILNVTESRYQFFLRHYLIFFTSFIGSIFFYFLALKRFSSWKIALLGTVFLITSPRIFASGFFNSKDIIFMYFFIINTFFAIIFLEKPNKFNSIMLSFVSALCIGVSVRGIILTILVLYFLWIKSLRKDYNFKIINSVLTLFLSLIFFIVLFWPSLWENPINNFTNSMTIFWNYDHDQFNFYLGSFVPAQVNHWHYIPLWICITTPLLIITLFVYGFLLSIRRIFCRLIKIESKVDLNDLWRGFSEFQDLIFVILVFAPIFLTIVFKSTLYTGWRHLYFIYPFIVLIGLNALRIIYLRLHLIKAQNIKRILNLIISIFIISNFFWIYKNHPFQNNYFNFFAGDKPHNNFEVDYWGLSNRFVLEKILNDDDKQIIAVSAISVTSLAHNFNILTEKQKKRIRYSKDLKSSDYIINNNIFLWGDKNKLKKIPGNFEVYYELFIDDILVTTIYKRSSKI